MTLSRFLVVMLLASPALADEATDQAKKLYSVGQTNFELGRYAEALDAFNDAYAKKALPGFLFNIGLCHRKLQHHDQAITFFSLYLKESPKAANHDDVVTMLAEERALAAATPATPTTPAATTAPPTPLTTDAAQAGAASTSATASSNASAGATNDDGTLLWVVGGGALIVAAAAVTGVALALTARPQPLSTIDLRGAPP